MVPPGAQQIPFSGGAPQPPPGRVPYGSVSAGRDFGNRRGVAGPVLLTAFATAALAVAGTLFATGAFTPAPVFDGAALEAGVQGVLVDTFGLTGITGTQCPAEIEVKPGLQFECTFDLGGQKRSVPVVVLNPAGQYRVGYAPEDAGGEASDTEGDATPTQDPGEG
jgi:Domain of unknown function (DUF4333)